MPARQLCGNYLKVERAGEGARPRFRGRAYVRTAPPGHRGGGNATRRPSCQQRRYRCGPPPPQRAECAARPRARFTWGTAVPARPAETAAAGTGRGCCQARLPRSPSEKYYATHLKAELFRSTNFSRDAPFIGAAGKIAARTFGVAILSENHSPIPLSRVAGLRGAEECYASNTPAPTPLLLSLFRVARIGGTRVLA